MTLHSLVCVDTAEAKAMVDKHLKTNPNLTKALFSVYKLRGDGIHRD